VPTPVIPLSPPFTSSSALLIPASILTQPFPSSPTTMAPPPPANLPLQERVLQLVQTLQFAWFAGHVTLLLSSVRYALSYLTFNASSKWAIFSYRTAFIAAAATYGIVVFKSFRARARAGKAQGGAFQIIGDENVQYLGESLSKLLQSSIFNTNILISHGSDLALVSSDPSCRLALRCLLHLPRCNLHQIKPSAHPPAPACCRCWREAQVFRPCRHHWQLR
jgi:hypothetical protein